MIPKNVRLDTKISPNNSPYHNIYPRVEEIFPSGRQTWIIGSFEEDGLKIKVPSLNLELDYNDYIGNPLNLPSEEYLKIVGDNLLDKSCFYQEFIPILEEDRREAGKDLENLFYQEDIVSAFIHKSGRLISKRESPVLYPKRWQFQKLERLLEKKQEIIQDRDLKGYAILSSCFDEGANLIRAFCDNYGSCLKGYPLDWIKALPESQEKTSKLVAELYDISSEKLTAINHTLNLVSGALKNK